jgi:hypothetical protein
MALPGTIEPRQPGSAVSQGTQQAYARHAAGGRTGSAPPPVQRPRSSAPPPRNPGPRVSTNSRGNYARPVAPPATKPGPVMDINAFLNQDAGYQQQLREFAKSVQDFTADVGRRRGNLESDYGTSSKALSDQRGLDLQAMTDDYGARGLLRSGLFADANSKYETEYNNRVTDLANRKEQALAALLQEQSQFQSAQDLQSQAAREAAIRRRAEQYGV